MSGKRYKQLRKKIKEEIELHLKIGEDLNNIAFKAVYKKIKRRNRAGTT